MAIPISWPSSDDVDDSYLSLDMLLEQLLVTLRQVVMQRRRELAVQRAQSLSQDNQCQINTEISNTEILVSQQTTIASDYQLRLPMPDIVQDIVPECEARQRRKLIRRPSISRTPIYTWIHVGAELRRIADLTRDNTTIHLPQTYENPEKSTQLQQQQKSTIMSQLRSNLSTPLWTTLALIVWWRFLSHTR